MSRPLLEAHANVVKMPHSAEPKEGGEWTQATAGAKSLMIREARRALYKPRERRSPLLGHRNWSLNCAADLETIRCREVVD
jgi:hypothetical protein